MSWCSGVDRKRGDYNDNEEITEIEADRPEGLSLQLANDIPRVIAVITLYDESCGRRGPGFWKRIYLENYR